MGARAAPEGPGGGADKRGSAGGHNSPSAFRKTLQNIFAKWSVESNSAGETGGALEGRPRQSRMARVASGG